MKKTAVCIISGLLCYNLAALANEPDERPGAAQKQNIPALLEFGADRRIPCIEMRPVIKKIDEPYRGRLAVIVIDADRSREQAVRFKIRFLPTPVFVDKTGKEYRRLVDGSSYEKISTVLKSAGI